MLLKQNHHKTQAVPTHNASGSYEGMGSEEVGGGGGGGGGGGEEREREAQSYSVTSRISASRQPHKVTPGRITHIQLQLHVVLKRSPQNASTNWAYSCSTHNTINSKHNNNLPLSFPPPPVPLPQVPPPPSLPPPPPPKKVRISKPAISISTLSPSDSFYDQSPFNAEHLKKEKKKKKVRAIE